VVAAAACVCAAAVALATARDDRAAPATIDGAELRLVKATPCMRSSSVERYGGGYCAPRLLRRGDPVLCLDRPRTLTFDPGGAATEVRAAAGRLRNGVSFGPRARARALVDLEVRRVEERSYAITIPDRLDPAVRQLLVDVTYADGVEIPYDTIDGEGDAFKRGRYAAYLRSRGQLSTVGPCR
jgi:hypothetical protein